MVEKNKNALSVLQIEPSMFTPPYAAGLDEGLTAAGANVTWITRAERRGEDFGVPKSHLSAIFYRGIDGNERIPKPLRSLLKGASHLGGLLSFAAKALRERPDVIHYQWTVIPILDIPVLLFLKKFVAPIVFTAHNTIPYHGDKISTFQNLGADWALKAANHIVVHTETSKKVLMGRGIAADKISVIPHGPHYLRVDEPFVATAPGSQKEGRYSFLLFGNIKPYKGFDILVKAVSRLSPEVRGRLRVVVAGQMHMDASDILNDIRKAGIADCFDLRFERQSEEQMSALFAEADAFVFPYRFIDASGVYYYIKPLKKWIIASKVGVFAEDMVDGESGALVPPADPVALAGAIEKAVTERPVVSSATPMPGWAEIGAMTKAMYLQLLPGTANASA